MTVGVTGFAYSRDCSLSAYFPVAAPSFDVRQRICELGLWTVCRLFDSRRRDIAYVRRYRSRRAGRRRPVPAITPVGNGAYIVKFQRLPRGTISCALPRMLTYLRDCSSADVREASASGSHLLAWQQNR